MEEESSDPEQEVDGSTGTFTVQSTGTSVSHPEEGTPGKLEEKDMKKVFMKSGDKNNEGDLSSSEECHVRLQVDPGCMTCLRSQALYYVTCQARGCTSHPSSVIQLHNNLK